MSKRNWGGAPASWLVLGSEVVARRKRLGLTQRAFAARCGLGFRTVQRIEQEPGVRFGWNVVARLHRGLCLPLILTDNDGLRSPILKYSA